MFEKCARLLALTLAVLVIALPLWGQNSGDGSTKSNRDYFILYADADGEVTCREALPAERKDLERVNPTGLRQINHLDDKLSMNAVTGSDDLPAHLTIILRATAQLDANPAAKAAFTRAAQNWENIIKSPVTIYLDVDYGTTNFGQPWGSGTLGSTSAPSVTATYQAVRSDLLASASSASETSIYNALPASSVPTDLGDSSSTSISRSIARAIGLLDPTALPTDQAARIGFNSNFAFDLNPDDGIGDTNGDGIADTDFDAVATHEIGHALGFTSRSGITATGAPTLAMWDLYRFRTGTTSGTFTTAPRIMTIGGTPDPLQFYFVPGSSELGLSTGGPSGSTTNGGDGRQSSHWKSSSGCTGNLIGIMAPAIPAGCRRTIMPADFEAANILGYNLDNSNPPPPPPPPPPAPGNDNLANAVVINGCSGNTTGTNISATHESGEPLHDPLGTPGGGSVWYQWIAPATGSVTIDTAGSGTNYDTTLGVYTGASVGSLTTIAKNDDVASGNTTSLVTFPATAGTLYKIAVDGWGSETGNFTLNWAQSNCTQTGSTLQLDQSSYTVNEGAGFATINVTRSGSTSSPATVKFATTDATDVNFNCNPANGSQPATSASRKCDYHLASGRLRFAAGETSKSIILSLVDDVYVESSETFTISLSDPTGATLGTPNTATVTITDNDTAGQPNPINGTPFYVRMLYVDLLSREPDPTGFAGWVHRIDFCGQPGEPPPPCDRVTVGGDGFLRSAEFFDREFFVLRLYRAGLGRILTYNDVADLAYVSGFLSVSDLELNKQELVADIMSRPEFSGSYNGLSNSAFVDKLIQTAAVAIPTSVRDGWVTALNGSSKTRAQVYRELSERQEVSDRYLHEAQVVSCYYGFFTRNPDGAYFSYLDRLDRGEINLGDLANAFINAAEYRQRFGP
jgi:hypothetical protein